MRLLIMLMLLSPLSWSADAVVTASAEPELKKQAAASLLEPSQVSSQLVQLLLGLLLVIGLIFLLAWLVRRIQQALPTRGANQAISLLASQALGPRDRLLLVQVGKEQILLGVTPGTIVPLHVLQEPIEVTTPDSPISSAFAQRLASVLKSSAKDAQ